MAECLEGGSIQIFGLKRVSLYWLVATLSHNKPSQFASELAGQI
jgi:hypothetical protein